MPSNVQMPYTIQLPARALTLMQAACMFCSTDKHEARLAVKCVFLTPVPGGLQIAATDQHAAFIGRVDIVGAMPENAGPVIIERAGLEAAIKALKKSVGSTFWLTAGMNAAVYLRTDVEVSAPSLSCPSLNFHRVAFRAHSEPRGLSDMPLIDVKYLEAVTKAAKILQKESRAYDDTEFKRVLLTAEIGGQCEQCYALDKDAIALVMGVRPGDSRPDYERTRAAIFGGLE